jgi:enamine deaminase RidA (YjgF/YER057c/UK114 family)
MAITHYQNQTPDFTLSRVSRFETDEGQLEEFHVCIEAPPTGDFATQLTAVENHLVEVTREHGLDSRTTVFRRVFLSDAANQEPQLRASSLVKENSESPIAVSVIEQPPFEGRRLSIWEYHVRGKSPITKRRTSSGVALDHAGKSHIWTSGLVREAENGAYAQTDAVLAAYEHELESLGANLRDHAIRTWFFINDIDSEYTDLVAARKRYFDSIGLTADTHYVASTGIAGRVASSKYRVTLDAYAISNLQPSQVKYLSAPQYLGPTHLYGVTFERGTRVDYRDRNHVFISGTASIDPSGQTLYVGDIRKQCERAFENVEALLGDAGGHVEDLGQLIAYVRDSADGALVSAFLDARCPNVPRVVVKAPVCRPNWLVEFECVALLAKRDETQPEF